MVRKVFKVMTIRHSTKSWKILQATTATATLSDNNGFEILHQQSTTSQTFHGRHQLVLHKILMSLKTQLLPHISH